VGGEKSVPHPRTITGDLKRFSIFENVFMTILQTDCRFLDKKCIHRMLSLPRTQIKFSILKQGLSGDGKGSDAPTYIVDVNRRAINLPRNHSNTVLNRCNQTEQIRDRITRVRHTHSCTTRTAFSHSVGRGTTRKSVCTWGFGRQLAIQKARLERDGRRTT